MSGSAGSSCRGLGGGGSGDPGPRKPGDHLAAQGRARQTGLTPPTRTQRPGRKPRPLKDGRLDPYRRKRDFETTPEPLASERTAAGNLFVVQKHAATRLHYDLRLEMGGVLRSWAVTRGPSLDPRERRLAVHVEDHPISYGEFEGAIPAGQYGAGTVIVWDRGTWAPMVDVQEGLRKGDLKFRLAGSKMKGGWALVRIRGEEKNWLLIKESDAYAEPGTGDGLVRDRPESVVSGLTIEEMATLAPPPVRRRRVARPRVGSLPGARKAELGDVPRPQLATLADAPPVGAEWVHEIKFDGYRTLARIDRGDVRLFTRNGHDWTRRYAPIAKALTELACRTAMLDGEVCVQLPSGATGFAALQDALAEGASEKLTYFAFDLLHLDGYDLSRAPLSDRKRALEAVLAPAVDERSPIQYSEHFDGDGAAFLAQAAQHKLEGIVSKRAGAPYATGRSRQWLKVKSVAADEFVIVGYTRSQAAGGLAALLLAEPCGDGLAYVGKVGAGLSEQAAAELMPKLAPLARSRPVFTLRAHDDAPGAATWTEPRLRAEVRYANRTPKGHLRAPVFKGLRGDLEPPAESGGARPERAVTDADLAAVWITNPERRMFGADGPTKLDLAVYYARVGDWVLPGIADRPLTLVRCPTGKADDCFYQRHALPGMPAEIKRIALSEEGGAERADFLYVSEARGLLSLAQFGVVEFHPWGCRVDRPERPDRLVIDLDPDEGMDWLQVTRAAFELRDALTELGLRPLPRTTGGAGLHLVVALQRGVTWPRLKEFAQHLVGHLAESFPGRYTANRGKTARKGRIFLDYLRNTRSATAVGSYSLRARPGAPAATPLSWAELRSLDDPRDLNWRTVPERLRTLVADPWGALAASAARVTKELRAAVAPKGRRRAS